MLRNLRDTLRIIVLHWRENLWQFQGWTKLIVKLIRLGDVRSPLHTLSWWFILIIPCSLIKLTGVVITLSRLVVKIKLMSIRLVRLIIKVIGVIRLVRFVVSLIKGVLCWAWWLWNRYRPCHMKKLSFHLIWFYLYILIFGPLPQSLSVRQFLFSNREPT